MPVNEALFEKTFGIPWKQALAEGKVFNALEACKVLNVDAAGLDALWATSKKAKFGGGTYCGLINGRFVWNGFFMEVRCVRGWIETHRGALGVGQECKGC